MRASIPVLTTESYLTDPCRPRDWLWRLGSELAGFTIPAIKKYTKIINNPSVWRVVIYIFNKLRPTCQLSLAKQTGVSDQLDCDLSAAERIWVNAEFMRWAIEAMVLADYPVDAIAVEFGCSPGIIETYEACFYDIRNRRGNTLFILNELLSPAVKEGTYTPEYDFLWKAMAYWDRMDLLKAMWQIRSLTEKELTDIGELVTALRSKNMLCGMSIRKLNNFNIHDAVEEQIALEANKAKDKEGPEAVEHSDSLLQAVLSSVQFRVAPKIVNAESVELPLSREINKLADKDNSCNNSNTADLASRAAGVAATKSLNAIQVSDEESGPAAVVKIAPGTVVESARKVSSDKKKQLLARIQQVRGQIKR
jgi:hypothetical protein